MWQNEWVNDLEKEWSYNIIRYDDSGNGLKITMCTITYILKTGEGLRKLMIWNVI